jgi:RNA polymerase-binding transcription factor DksA
MTDRVSKSSEWTPEQIENAMRYGICLECGFPLELRIERNEHDVPTSMGIECPNRHDQAKESYGTPKW